MSQYESLSLPEQLTRAINFARLAHAGQYDAGGQPYIGHCLRVAENFRTRLEEARPAGHESDDYYHGLIASVLHDVVEDTPVTVKMLKALGLPERAVEVVGLMTWDPAVCSRETYYHWISKDWLAVLVKAADMDDNTDPGRLAVLEDAPRRRRKYAKGYAALGVKAKHPLGEPAG